MKLKVFLFICGFRSHTEFEVGCIFIVMAKLMPWIIRTFSRFGFCYYFIVKGRSVLKLLYAQRS